MDPDDLRRMLNGPSKEELSAGFPPVRLQDGVLARTVGLSASRFAYVKAILIARAEAPVSVLKKLKREAMEDEIVSPSTLYAQVQLSLEQRAAIINQNAGQRLFSASTLLQAYRRRGVKYKKVRLRAQPKAES